VTFQRFAASVLCAALVGSIALANWLTSRYGPVPAGFGLMVTAGTYAAGLSLGLRDALHEAGGYRWVLVGIAAGIGLSGVLGEGRIAVASAVAFGVAELADLSVYVPLRRRSWRTAVVTSNAVGAVADTFLFLWIAGFPLTPELVGGQLLVKAVWMTVLAVVVGEGITRARRRRTA
jgi:queuosine precursor transporter